MHYSRHQPAQRSFVQRFSDTVVIVISSVFAICGVLGMLLFWFTLPVLPFIILASFVKWLFF